MPKSFQPAAEQATTDAAVRWLVGALLIVCLGFAASLLLDHVTQPQIAVTTSSAVR